MGFLPIWETMGEMELGCSLVEKTLLAGGCGLCLSLLSEMVISGLPEISPSFYMVRKKGKVTLFTVDYEKCGILISNETEDGNASGSC